MKPNLTIYRGRIAKIRYYLAQLSGGGDSDAWIDECAFNLSRGGEHYAEDKSRIKSIITSHAPRNPDVLKYCALITYELNRLPYAPPQPKRGFIAKLIRILKHGN